MVVAIALLLLFRINVNHAGLGIKSSTGRAAFVLLIRTAKLTNHYRRPQGEDHGHHDSEHEDQPVRQTIPRISIVL